MSLKPAVIKKFMLNVYIFYKHCVYNLWYSFAIDILLRMNMNIPVQMQKNALKICQVYNKILQTRRMVWTGKQRVIYNYLLRDYFLIS